MQKNANRSLSITLHKTQVQMDQRPQHTTRYTESHRRDSRKQVQHIGTGNKFLKRTPIFQALRSRTDKWDLMKLESFYKAQDTVNKTNWQPTDWGKKKKLH